MPVRRNYVRHVAHRRHWLACETNIPMSKIPLVNLPSRVFYIMQTLS